MFTGSKPGFLPLEDSRIRSTYFQVLFSCDDDIVKLYVEQFRKYYKVVQRWQRISPLPLEDGLPVNEERILHILYGQSSVSAKLSYVSAGFDSVYYWYGCHFLILPFMKKPPGASFCRSGGQSYQ